VDVAYRIHGRRYKYAFPEITNPNSNEQKRQEERVGGGCCIGLCISEVKVSVVPLWRADKSE
jgi:hypothetical protein